VFQHGSSTAMPNSCNTSTTGSPASGCSHENDGTNRTRRGELHGSFPFDPGDTNGVLNQQCALFEELSMAPTRAEPPRQDETSRPDTENRSPFCLRWRMAIAIAGKACPKGTGPRRLG
jgi:hypothetical protein